MNNKHQLMKTRGFTLIELIVVIAIIGLLSTISAIMLGNIRKTSRDSQRLADVKQVQSALEFYYADRSVYPVVDPAQPLGEGNYACLGAQGFGPVGCADAYMGRLPADPGKAQYLYTSGNGSTYTISTKLEGEINGFQGTIQATPTTIQNSGS